jgi:tetratricopeptide (TPR) repeat protein
VLLCAALAVCEEIPRAKLDRIYQSAVAYYEAGRYADAASQLEGLLPYGQKSFEVHELLGMVYASLSQDAKAERQLKAAVELMPASAVARTNLAACLVHSGSTAEAMDQLRAALKLDPGSYEANHNLGELYIESGKFDAALPLLDQAQQANPVAYGNSYDLAMTEYLLGRLDEARRQILKIEAQQNSGDLHDLLGKVNEKDGKFLEAANEYETAAHMDPSEDHLFDWGSEMLLHRTYEAAIAVFEEGVRRFPQSPRLQIGLGLSLYSRGKYDDAVHALLRAADLEPSDARCYLFLSKAYDSSPSQAEGVIERFKRYALLKPDNALAQYYYAMSLWKGKRAEDADLNLQMIESLLKRATDLDDALPEAHVQLGNLYADQHLYEKSIPQYVRALELNPNLSDAHYRLGTDYVHVGQKDRAQKEFEVYQKLRSEHLAEIDKERAEVQQFVSSAKPSGQGKP